MQSPRSPGDDGDASYWGTLINPDKSPAPLLEELCTGLAKLMVSHSLCRRALVEETGSITTVCDS